MTQFICLSPGRRGIFLKKQVLDLSPEGKYDLFLVCVVRTYLTITCMQKKKRHVDLLTLS